MRLPDDYIAACERRARRYQGQWTGTAGSLAADSRRLQIEREELLATIDDLERANADLRAAVEARLAKASPMAASLAGCKPAQEAAIACLAPAPAQFTRAATSLAAADLPAGVPEEYRLKHAGATFVPAAPQPAAVFDEPIAAGSTLSPEQLDALWSAARSKAGARPDEPIQREEFRAKTARLIGLTGPAGAGKNTVAAMIPDAVVIQLADPLYAALAVMLGMPETLLRHRATKESPLPWLGKSPRQLLQTLGTDWGRQIVAQDLWVRLADRRVDELTAAGAEIVVIADVRFQNEAEWIRSRGGHVWFIDRKPAAGCVPHASEDGLPECSIDRWIDNTGTPEQTREDVALALRGQ